MTPRVFVACRECRAAGWIAGRWFDATSAPEEMAAFELATRQWWRSHPTERRIHLYDKHTELTVLDHTGFGSRLHGETTVSRAAEIARQIEEEK